MSLGELLQFLISFIGVILVFEITKRPLARFKHRPEIFVVLVACLSVLASIAGASVTPTITLATELIRSIIVVGVTGGFLVYGNYREAQRQQEQGISTVEKV